MQMGEGVTPSLGDRGRDQDSLWKLISCIYIDFPAVECWKDQLPDFACLAVPVGHPTRTGDTSSRRRGASPLGTCTLSPSTLGDPPKLRLQALPQWPLCACRSSSCRSSGPWRDGRPLPLNVRPTPLSAEATVDHWAPQPVSGKWRGAAQEPRARSGVNATQFRLQTPLAVVTLQRGGAHAAPHGGAPAAPPRLYLDKNTGTLGEYRHRHGSVGRCGAPQTWGPGHAPPALWGTRSVFHQNLCRQRRCAPPDQDHRQRTLRSTNGHSEHGTEAHPPTPRLVPLDPLLCRNGGPRIWCLLSQDSCPHLMQVGLGEGAPPSPLSQGAPLQGSPSPRPTRLRPSYAGDHVQNQWLHGVAQAQGCCSGWVVARALAECPIG